MKLLLAAIVLAATLRRTSALFGNLPEIEVIAAHSDADNADEIEALDIIERKLRYNLITETWPDTPDFNWTAHYSEFDPFITGLLQLAVGDARTTECTRYPLPNYADPNEADLARQHSPSEHVRLMKYLRRYKKTTGSSHHPFMNGRGTIQLVNDGSSFCARLTLDDDDSDYSFDYKTICEKNPEANHRRPCRYVYFPRFLPAKSVHRTVLIGYDYVGPNDCRDEVWNFGYAKNELLVINSNFLLGRRNLKDLKTAVFYNSVIRAAARSGTQASAESNLMFLQLVKSTMVWNYVRCWGWWCVPSTGNEVNVRLAKLSRGSEFVVERSTREAGINITIDYLILSEADTSKNPSEYVARVDAKAVFDSRVIKNGVASYASSGGNYSFRIGEVKMSPINQKPTDIDGARPDWACSQRFADYFEYFWRRNTVPPYQYQTSVYTDPVNFSDFNTRSPCPDGSTLEYMEKVPAPRCVNVLTMCSRGLKLCGNLIVTGRDLSTGIPVVAHLPLDNPTVNATVERYKTDHSMYRSTCLVDSENLSAHPYTGWESLLGPKHFADELTRI